MVNMCQESLPSAEDNYVFANANNDIINIWRWRMCGKSFFHLGRLEDSLDSLGKLENAVSMNHAYK